MKNAFWLFFIAIVIALIFIPSFSRMQDKAQRNREYDARLQQLKREQSNLAVEKKRLEEDPDYLEKVAREKMGLVREGETIYRIEGSSNIEKK